MALEALPSRLAASRYEHYLSVEAVSAGELPLALREYDDPAYRVELRVLYEKESAFRRQWLLLDAAGTVRLVSAARYPPPASEEGTAGAEAQNEVEFIELYDESHLITAERRFSPDGSETVTGYFYNKQALLRVETWRKDAPAAETGGERSRGNTGNMENTGNDEIKDDEPEDDKTENDKIENNESPVIEAAPVLLTTDYYRYNRSSGLRSVERVYHEAAGSAPEAARLRFPRLGLSARVDENFVTPGTPYRSDIPPPRQGERAVYTTNQRGKVVTETREDAEGAVQGEIRNTWDGNRLKAVGWKTGGDERRTEYDYNGAGDRIVERNYRNGVLERVIREEDGKEIEELDMNGRLILRAVWENGRKISETPLRGF
jgi:hypothetical protein